MKDSKRLLIAVDDSEVSHKAVAYVSAMVDGRPGYYVCLLHGLPPVPPVEHSGAEDPLLEKLLDADLQKKTGGMVKARMPIRVAHGREGKSRIAGHRTI